MKSNKEVSGSSKVFEEGCECKQACECESLGVFGETLPDLELPLRMGGAQAPVHTHASVQPSTAQLRLLSVMGRPGAHRVSPMSGSDAECQGNLDDNNEWDSSGRTEDSPGSSSPSAGTASSSDGTEGLAVASMVEDSQDLPMAEHVLRPSNSTVGGAEDQRQHEQTKRLNTSVLMLVVALVAIVVLVVAVTISGSNHNVSTDAASFSPEATIAPTTIGDTILSFFPQDTVTAITQDPNSPQSHAFQWLLQDDLLPHMFQEQIKQRFALATLYYATNGDEWSDNVDWLDYNTHECNWFNKQDFALKSSFDKALPGYLAELPPRDDPSLARCDSQTGLYTNLWLDQNNLVGTIPPELYWLTSLQTLALGANPGLQGPISTHVGKLTNLQGLVHSQLQNAGPIPSEIGLLTSMRMLILNGNYHEGSIPTELWQLSNLTTLLLTRNPSLRGTIPTEIGTLHRMRWLMLDDTDITGTVPTEIGQLQRLHWLTLYLNSLTGTIPSEVGLLSNIFLISLHGNMLEGSIPTQLGLLQAASGLVALRDNQLTGPIPSELGLLTNLKVTLNLRNNLLSGTIPTELGLLSNIHEVSISDNHLSGTIPTELGLLSSIGQLSLANNTLSGTIPQELAPLWQSLHTLYLEGNAMFSGIIPESLCTLNGTCIGSTLDQCEPPFGLWFDCTDSSNLCGCGCSCSDEE